MQCPSCAFENIPGQASCGRCGTRLDLRTAAIDVMPPRARRGVKRLRTLVPRRDLYRVRDGLSDAVRRSVDHLERDAFVPVPEPGLAVRLLAPGWGQAYQGRALRGAMYAAPYLVLLVVGLLNWGSFGGSVALGLLLSIHASATLDALLSLGRVPFPALLRTAACVVLGLGLLIYAPAGWALSHVAAIRGFDREGGLFARGDRVVVNEWAFALRDPSLGQVVLFEPGLRGRMPTAARLLRYRFVQEENQFVDRVLAGPGDAVAWDRKADTLLVNGRATGLRPLRPDRLPDRLDVQVPPGRYLVLPTTSEVLNRGSPPESWALAGTVAREQVLAGAYLRLPLGRLWWIR